MERPARRRRRPPVEGIFGGEMSCRHPWWRHAIAVAGTEVTALVDEMKRPALGRASSSGIAALLDRNPVVVIDRSGSGGISPVPAVVVAVFRRALQLAL